MLTDGEPHSESADHAALGFAVRAGRKRGGINGHRGRAALGFAVRAGRKVWVVLDPGVFVRGCGMFARGLGDGGVIALG